ncbi:hypothetical protein ACFYW6_36665 [Streptomyces sp. NPDC002659]|uniref:hypothetical protein n=1 Tax=Streptomyces sp. NPDC002659 TaxID=3364656 RepID=UPI0036C7E70F
MTTQQQPVPLIASPGRPGETASCSDDEPIYTALAACWARSGRMVPGRPDAQWASLTDHANAWPALRYVVTSVQVIKAPDGGSS